MVYNGVSPLMVDLYRLRTSTWSSLTSFHGFIMADEETGISLVGNDSRWPNEGLSFSLGGLGSGGIRLWQG